MEVTVHIIIWLSTVLYSLYRMFLFTRRVDNFSTIRSMGNLNVGWSLIGEFKDGSDTEWENMKSLAFCMYPWILANFCGAEIFRSKRWQPELWYIFVSFSFICYKFGYEPLLFLTLQPLFFLVIIKLGGKSYSIWVLSILFMIVLNVWKKNIYKTSVFKYDYMMMVAGLWIHLRCISFSLEAIKARGKEIFVGQKVLSALAFTFYLPLLFFGPFLLYNDFKKSCNYNHQPSFKRRLCCFCLNSSRFIGYSFIIEFCLHFVYFNALNYKTIETMLDWSLYGGGLWMGIFFQLKFLVWYGMAGTLAALDHIEPETPPRCVLRIHLYSQMWKYFDSGLHKFLKTYIYKPSMDEMHKLSQNHSIFKRIFVTMICFLFVFIWHGIEMHILVWVTLNYIGIVLESLGTSVSLSKLHNRFRMSILLTSSMNDRLNAFVATPLYTMSVLSNYYFFAGYEVCEQVVFDHAFHHFG